MMTKRNMIIASIVVLVLAGVLAASGWGQNAYTIGIESKEGVGSYLVDSKGMTLYTSDKDSQGKSTCTGECAGMWPEFYSKSISVPPGLKPLYFRAITRGDGKKQTTYKGLPLYYFVGDEKPGDTKGNGVHNMWFPAAPSGDSR